MSEHLDILRHLWPTIVRILRDDHARDGQPASARVVVVAHRDDPWTKLHVPMEDAPVDHGGVLPDFVIATALRPDVAKIFAGYKIHGVAVLDKFTPVIAADPAPGWIHVVTLVPNEAHYDALEYQE